MASAKLILDKAFQIGKVDKHIYSSFIEDEKRMAQAMYDPEHPSADEQGFRQDVMELIRELHTPAIRFPGGNYVSNYDWHAGIGPREARPVINDIVHGEIDENWVGIDDFADYSQKLGTEFMIAANLGTGTIADVRDEVEYCNIDGETYWSNKRKVNGHEKPHKLKYWYLGNEMDGPWQVGQMTAEEYASKARQAAQIMKMTDPSVELIVCGTSAIELPSYPDWDRIVLERTFPYVEMLSVHKYYYYDARTNNEFGSPFTVRDLAYLPVDFDRILRVAEGTIDYVKAKLRTKRDVTISVDEWGLNSSTNIENPEEFGWTERVWPINEENVYPFGNLIDALIYGIFLISFLNHADRVKHACRSLLRYTTMTAQKNGIALKHTPYYVMQMMAQYGQGVALRNAVISPSTQTEHYGEASSIFTGATYNAETNEVVVFALNLSLTEDVDLSIELNGFEQAQMVDHQRLYDDQALAGNTYEQPERIIPEKAALNEKVRLEKHSFHMLRYSVK